ncbi:MAG TPA: hypothetical protein VHN98_12440 [Acidimicrobiales bacterium]|nr:hypothetical protein [Acidimicrobiales bacterium]
MRKSIAALAVAASVAGGGVAGALLGVPALSGAQSSDSSSTTTQAPPQTPAGPKSGPIENALKGLVDKGTITQEQADAVRNAIKDEVANMPHPGPGRHGPDVKMGAELKVAADALGMTEADLRTALQGGKTLAQVAQDKGVDVNKVIDALVADATSHIDQAVTAGKLTQQQADTMKSNLKDRLTQMVNNARPPMRAPHGRHGHGMWGPEGGNTGNGSGSTTTPSPNATPQSFTTTA